MPNQPKTPLHSFRVATELWDECKQLARENNETIADVLREAIETYIASHRDERGEEPVRLTSPPADLSGPGRGCGREAGVSEL